MIVGTEKVQREAGGPVSGCILGGIPRQGGKVVAPGCAPLYTEKPCSPRARRPQARQKRFPMPKVRLIQARHRVTGCIFQVSRGILESWNWKGHIWKIIMGTKESKMLRRHRPGLYVDLVLQREREVPKTQRQFLERSSDWKITGCHPASDGDP